MVVDEGRGWDFFTLFVDIKNDPLGCTLNFFLIHKMIENGILNVALIGRLFFFCL